MIRTNQIFHLYAVLLFISLIIEGCSPHGDMSRITRIGGGSAEISLPSLFGGKAKSSMTAGSASNQTTGDNYKVNFRIGTQFTQTATQTAGNYKVYTSFNKKIAK